MIDRLSRSMFPPGRESAYDTIIGMQRGGVIVGTLLETTISGYKPDAPELSFMPAIYSSQNKRVLCDEKLKYLRSCIEEQRVLLVDDVVVTGKSMDLCKTRLDRLNPKSVTTVSLMWLDPKQAGIPEALSLYRPDVMMCKIRRETNPPWRPFASMRVPQVITLTYSLVETLQLISRYAKIYGYSIQRELAHIELWRDIDGYTSIINVIVETEPAGTKLRIFNNIAIEKSFDKLVSLKELEEMRMNIVLEELLRFVEYIQTPPSENT